MVVISGGGGGCYGGLRRSVLLCSLTVLLLLLVSSLSMVDAGKAKKWKEENIPPPVSDEPWEAWIDDAQRFFDIDVQYFLNRALCLINQTR